MNKRHCIWLLSKVFTDLEKALSLKWGCPPREAFHWRRGERSADPAVRPIVECSIGVSPGEEDIVLSQTSYICVSVTQSCLNFVTPWTAAWQDSLSFTNYWSLLTLMYIESVMPSNHLILCYPFVLSSSIFSTIRVFSNESVLYIRWPKYWSFNFNISPSNEHPELISFSSWCPRGSQESFPTPQFKSINSSLWYNFHIHTWPLEKP